MTQAEMYRGPEAVEEKMMIQEMILSVKVPGNVYYCGAQSNSITFGSNTLITHGNVDMFLVNIQHRVM